MKIKKIWLIFAVFLFLVMLPLNFLNNSKNSNLLTSYASTSAGVGDSYSPTDPSNPSVDSTTKKVLIEDTSILDELTMIEDFNVSKYCNVIKEDNKVYYSYLYNENINMFSFIILTEDSGKVYVYVFNPMNYNLTTITISTGLKLEFKIYSLGLIKSDNVFEKYEVKNLSVSEEKERYYEITEIHREIEEGEIVPIGTTEIAQEVALKYVFKNIGNGVISVDKSYIDVVTVINKYVGYVRYPSGFFLNNNACYSHFVAFSTDWSIDKLFKADVYFKTQSFETYNYFGNHDTYGDVKENYVFLSCDNKVRVAANGMFTNKYDFTRIETVDEFIENVSGEKVYEHGIFNDNQETTLDTSKLESCDWVLRFYESDYSVRHAGNTDKITSTIVEDVTILRLYFETGGETYNLGVVDNKTNSDTEPINNTKDTLSFNWEKLDEWLKSIEKVIAIVLVVVLIVALLPVITPIITFIIDVILSIFKALKNIITTLFNKKDKGRRKR